jgi:hypothetical protein
MKAVSKLITPRIVGCLAVASGMLGVSSLVSTGGGAAQADPSWTTGFVGVGADVTQDLWAAYTGASPAPGLDQTNTTFYSPLNAGQANNFLTVESYDANPPGEPTTTAGAIITTAGGNAWDRPNSTTSGLLALYDETQGISYEGNPSFVGKAVNIEGQVAFARTARGPSGKLPGNALTFIPYARDGLGVLEYTAPGSSPASVGSLTEAELAALYSTDNGEETINGLNVYACLTISGSTPRSNLESALGVSDTTASAAVADADAGSVTGGLCPSITQNNGNAFYSAVSSLPAGSAAVIPISAGSWESQANDVALDRSATARANGIDLADITNASNVDLGKPYGSGTIGSGPNAGKTGEVANPTYYADSAWGYSLYTAVPTPEVNSSFDGGFDISAPLEALFVGSGSALCSSAAQSTAHDFGFASLSGGEGTCGSITTEADG